MAIKQTWEKTKKIVLSPNFKEIVFLIALFIVSFVFRRIGLKYGFPLLTHPDEPISLEPVYHMTENRTFNPADFKRPDQIHYFVYFIYLNFISYIKFGKSFADTFYQNQLAFYFYARFLIAVIGSVIPIIAYRLGKEFKLDFSIPAALLFAFFPYYVFHSHYITPDITITFFTLVIILFSIRYLKSNNEKQIYLATIFAAINTAEKYPGLLSFSIIIVALFLSLVDIRSTDNKFDFRVFFKKLSLLIGLYLLVLFISAPNLFIEYGKVIDSFIFEARSTHLGADNLGWGGNILFYIKMFIQESNFIILVFVLIGLIINVTIKNKTGFLLLYGFAYCILMSRLGLHWVRWALPMYTAPLLLAGLGMAYSLEKFKNVKLIKYLVLIAFSLAITQQMITSLAASARMGSVDTRVVALEYCQQNGITTENSLYEGYTPLYPQFPRIIITENPENSESTIKYIVLSSNMYNRYFNEPERYEKEVNYYLNIERNHELLIQINPTTDPNNLIEKLEDIYFYFVRYFHQTPNERYTGPTIKIFRINNK